MSDVWQLLSWIIANDWFAGRICGFMLHLWLANLPEASNIIPLMADGRPAKASRSEEAVSKEMPAAIISISTRRLDYEHVFHISTHFPIHSKIQKESDVGDVDVCYPLCQRFVKHDRDHWCFTESWHSRLYYILDLVSRPYIPLCWRIFIDA